MSDTIKEVQLISYRDREIFNNELKRKTIDGWKIIPHTFHTTVEESKPIHLSVIYSVLVEQEY